MSPRAKTYDDHLKYCKEIEAHVEESGLSYPLLATLARLFDKQGKQSDAWFMQSEFAAIGADILGDRDLIDRKFRKYDWHPTGVKGTYVYRINERGTALLQACKERISMAGLKLYY